MPNHLGSEFGLTDRQKEALIERQAAELLRLRCSNRDLLAALKVVDETFSPFTMNREGLRVLLSVRETISEAEGRS